VIDSTDKNIPSPKDTEAQESTDKPEESKDRSLEDSKPNPAPTDKDTEAEESTDKPGESKVEPLEDSKPNPAPSDQNTGAKESTDKPEESERKPLEDSKPNLSPDIQMAHDVESRVGEHESPYQLVTRNMNWTSAARYCQSQYEQGHLLIINDDKKRLAVAKYLSTFRGQQLCSLILCCHKPALLCVYCYVYCDHNVIVVTTIICGFVVSLLQIDVHMQLKVNSAEHRKIANKGFK